MASGVLDKPNEKLLAGGFSLLGLAISESIRRTFSIYVLGVPLGSDW